MIFLNLILNKLQHRVKNAEENSVPVSNFELQGSVTPINQLF